MLVTPSFNFAMTSLVVLALRASALPSLITSRASSDPWPQAALDLCSKSVNCKVVNGQPVMDLTSTHAKRYLKMRDAFNDPNSTVIIPNNETVDTSTCVPSDMVNSALTQNCESVGRCTTDSSSFQCSQPSTITGSETITCTVTQDGWYSPNAPPDFYRDMFAAALSSAAKGLTTQQVNNVAILPPRPLPGSPHLTRDVTTFNTSIVPTSIAATTSQVIDDQNTTVTIGMVRYSIDCPQPADPACSDLLALAGVAGTLLGLFDPAEIGIAISAAVGAVSTVCN